MVSMDPGLCGHCVHCQVIDGVRSRFYLCRLAAIDPRFRRYPSLPVIACPGHQEGPPSQPGARSSGNA